MSKPVSTISWRREDHKRVEVLGFEPRFMHHPSHDERLKMLSIDSSELYTSLFTRNMSGVYYVSSKTSGKHWRRRKKWVSLLTITKKIHSHSHSASLRMVLHQVSLSEWLYAQSSAVGTKTNRAPRTKRLVFTTPTHQAQRPHWVRLWEKKHNNRRARVITNSSSSSKSLLD